MESLIRRLEAHLRGRAADVLGRVGKGLNGGPVDDPIGCRAWSPPAWAETTEECGVGDVGSDESDTTDHLGQVEVGGTNDLDPLDVNQLVVEHVLCQQHLARAANDVTQVEPGRTQDHLGLADPVDGGCRDEGEAATHPDHQAADRRVGLPVGPAGDNVVQTADLLPGLVAHRATQKAGQRHNGIKDTLGCQDAARAAAALVRPAICVAANERG